MWNLRSNAVRRTYKLPHVCWQSVNNLFSVRERTSRATRVLESEVFGLSRIPKNSRSRILLSDSGSPIESILTRACWNGTISFEIFTETILAAYHDFQWLLVATKLLTAKLYSFNAKKESEILERSEISPPTPQPCEPHAVVLPEHFRPLFTCNDTSYWRRVCISMLCHRGAVSKHKWWRHDATSVWNPFSSSTTQDICEATRILQIMLAAKQKKNKRILAKKTVELIIVLSVIQTFCI